MQLFGGARNELGRDFDTIDLLNVILNLPGAHTAGIERDHGLGEVADRGLTLGDDLGIELALAVAWGFDFHFSEIAAHGFGGGAVAGVAAAPALRRVMRIPEMLFHFQLEESFQSLFDQAIHNGFGIHRRSPSPGADLGHEEFLKSLRVLG